MALDDTLAFLDTASRKALWTKLRDEVALHEPFKKAVWTLPEQELASLRSLAEKYAPADPVSTIVPLFNTLALDETADLSSCNQRRTAALQQLFAEAGPEAVLQLAVEARTPYLIVEAAASAGFSEQQVAELLSLGFERDSNSMFTVGLSELYRSVAGAERSAAWIRKMAEERDASAEVVGGLFQAWPNGLKTWNVVRQFGPEVVAAYWKQRPPRYLRGSRSELLRSLLMLLRYGRAIEAIASSLDRMSEIPSKLILRMVDGVIPQLNLKSTAPDAMTSYYIEKALEELDRRGDVTEQDIAGREYRFLPLLEYGNRTLRIHDFMAKDPAFFHSILRNVYRGKSEEKGEVDAQTEANARLSYSLLSHFSRLPGQGSEGIDSAALSAWIDEVRRLGAETDRSEITDSYVGRVLAHAPSDPDGAWPHQAVRNEIERVASDATERAIQTERYNMRGTVTRGVYDGGDQERTLAKTNYDAAAVAAPWPRTAALLRAIGQMWDEEGKREDIEAAQRRLRS